MKRTTLLAFIISIGIFIQPLCIAAQSNSTPKKFQGFLGSYHPFKGTAYGGDGWTEGELIQNAFDFGENAMVSQPSYNGYTFAENVENNCHNWNVNKLYGMNLNSLEVAEFFEKIREKRDVIKTSEDVVINAVGKDLYEKFFRGYTRKQWGLDPSELDASVTSRVPTRTNRDDRYFTDMYQAMPLHGYTRMFENMLDSPNIKVLLNCDYREILRDVHFKEMVYTGPVDAYFDYRYGYLPYRSLEFRHETHDSEIHQAAPVINYPNEQPYTRVTEFKYLTGQVHKKTGIVYEYPRAEGDPYYPIPRKENAELYAKYKALADLLPNVHFVGRLATYKYYNMDQIVAQALTVYGKIAGMKRKEASAAMVVRANGLPVTVGNSSVTNLDAIA